MAFFKKSLTNVLYNVTIYSSKYTMQFSKKEKLYEQGYERKKGIKQC